MTDAAKSTFAYVTFIRTTPEKLWMALTNPEFTKQYWFGVRAESEWTVGSAWKLVFKDGGIADTGEILESDPPKRLIIKWRNEFRPELKAEGYSRCTFDLEQIDDVVKLSILHEIDQPNSKLVVAVSGGWPLIMSNLKSLLEIGSIIVKTKP